MNALLVDGCTALVAQLKCCLVCVRASSSSCLLIYSTDANASLLGRASGRILMFPYPFVNYFIVLIRVIYFIQTVSTLYDHSSS
jgi:hypothetical protein